MITRAFIEKVALNISKLFYPLLSLHYFLSATCKRVTIFFGASRTTSLENIEDFSSFCGKPVLVGIIADFRNQMRSAMYRSGSTEQQLLFFADVKYHAGECLRCCNFLSQKDGVAARCGARPMRMRRAFSERTHSKPTRARKSGALCNEFGRIRCMKPRCMAA